MNGEKSEKVKPRTQYRDGLEITTGNSAQCKSVVVQIPEEPQFSTFIFHFLIPSFLLDIKGKKISLLYRIQILQGDIMKNFQVVIILLLFVTFISRGLVNNLQ